jgi:hypothetical protein
MSEAELHFIRARLIGGQLSKARRGELAMALPVRLVYDPTAKVVLDPDTGVQQAIRHLFTLFARTGSARATVQQFNADGVLFPVRVRTGARKGELAWMPLQHWRVLRTLHNPRYAGAFAYGRRRERLAANGKKSYQRVPREQWIALIPDAHPGYISWDQYETNQKLLLGNATAHGADRAAGPAREGAALLQGLAICGRCGRRMTVRYHTRRGVEVPDYQCQNRCIQDGAARCQTIPGAVVDDAVATLLLDTLTPHAFEVALTVQAELDSRAGGTTGRPKGVIGTAGEMLTMIAIQLTEWEWPANPRFLMCAPLAALGGTDVRTAKVRTVRELQDALQGASDPEHAWLIEVMLPRMDVPRRLVGLARGNRATKSTASDD